MNSQGYTKDNIHKGNTKIVAGGIDVDGLIRVGDQSAGGNGYVLPETKGTIGQVITMNADNTTSFQDVGGDVATGRLIQNFFQMTNPRTAFSPSNFNQLYVNKNGSDIITTADIEVGSSVRFRTKGYLNNGTAGQTAFGQFRLRIGVPNTSSTFDFYSTNQLFIRDVGMSAGTPNIGRGWWEINVTVTKVDASNNCTIGVSGVYNCVASTGVTSDTFDIQFYDNDATFTTRLPNNSSSNTVIPAPFWSALPATFQLELAWKQTAFDANAIATEYTIDYLNVGQEVLATTTAPATDHNSLANLNVGDPHQNYAILGGRSGGQVLSGGITPANFLTLKSHTAGANNVVVRDLDTRFDKALNMNNNAINNVLNINSGTNINLNPSGNVDINGDVDMGSNRIIGVPEIVGDGGDMTIRNGGGESIILNSATNKIDILNNNLNMNNNQIDNVAVVNNGLGSLALIGPSTTSSIVIDPDPANSVVIGGPNDVVVSSNNDVNIISNAGIINLNSNNTAVNVGGTPLLTIDATEVGIANTLNLNTNDITNGNFINANKIFCGDYETTTSFITFFGLGGITPSFSSGGLDMNNGAVNSVSSINNITPVGGLYAGTSDGTLITATTTESSILPLSGVGPGLTLPANGFSIGDSFHFVCSGDFSSNNGDTATLRIKANGTNLGVIVVQLTGATNEFYEIEIDFTIRNIGGAGVADIVSNIDFTYSDSGATSWRGSRVVFINNTTFDTTISNTLELTCQFSSSSANNSIQTRHATLGKVY